MIAVTACSDGTDAQGNGDGDGDGDAPGSGGGDDVGSGGTESAGAGGSGSGGLGSGGSASGSGGNTSNSDPVRHIFMLMGQSNMAGVADKQASDQNTDERLQIWGGCNQPAGQWNLANPPLNDCPGEKGWNLSTAVGPGMWFAKTLADHLPSGASLGVVGTAESGESINTFIEGGSHHQMILNKIAAVKDEPNSRFSGIIFHQGESDNNSPDWPGKVVQLYGEVKAAFGVEYDVPMILGELPAGGCCAVHNTRVHEAASMLPMGSYVTQDGTSVLDDGLHFDHASVVLMGQRYGDAMVDALGW